MHTTKNYLKIKPLRNASLSDDDYSTDYSLWGRGLDMVKPDRSWKFLIQYRRMRCWLRIIVNDDPSNSLLHNGRNPRSSKTLNSSHCGILWQQRPQRRESGSCGDSGGGAKSIGNLRHRLLTGSSTTTGRPSSDSCVLVWIQNQCPCWQNLPISCTFLFCPPMPLYTYRVHSFAVWQSKQSQTSECSCVSLWCFA